MSSGDADTTRWAHELAVAVRAAKDAGALIQAAVLRENKQVEEKKNASDLVTETDVQAERLILSVIKEAFPSHHMIGEEGTADGGTPPQLTDEPTWMCDPLDGTTNFVHGFPFVCVSLGLCIGREPVVGVVYNPVLNELFTASKGGGAQLNGLPIRCSGATQLPRALLATEVGTNRDADTFDRVFARIQALAQEMQSVRCGGSCALGLCSVACGRVDAFYEIGFGGCWDVAAGTIIAREAGAVVLDPAGGPFSVMARRVLASSPALAKPIADILRGVGSSQAEPGPPQTQC